MMIEFEKEVLDFLGLPSIPKKEFDGKPFKKGVAVIELASGVKAYAACSFNPDDGDTTPKICKVFSLEQFTKIEKIYVVPEYMATLNEVDEMDLDDDSKKRASELLEQAEKLELDSTEFEDVKPPINEYYFDNIKNDAEAKAFISSYNKRNKIKGRVPKTHEGLIMRLSVIYGELNK
jgi:hypothetical protein